MASASNSTAVEPVASTAMAIFGISGEAIVPQNVATMRSCTASPTSSSDTTALAHTGRRSGQNRRQAT